MRYNAKQRAYSKAGPLPGFISQSSRWDTRPHKLFMLQPASISSSQHGNHTPVSHFDALKHASSLTVRAQVLLFSFVILKSTAYTSQNQLYERLFLAPQEPRAETKLFWSNGKPVDDTLDRKVRLHFVDSYMRAERAHQQSVNISPTTSLCNQEGSISAEDDPGVPDQKCYPCPHLRVHTSTNAVVPSHTHTGQEPSGQ